MNALPLAPERFIHGYEQTRAIKVAAARFSEASIQLHRSNYAARRGDNEQDLGILNPDLACVLEAHRQNLDLGEVQFLPHLCFPIDGAQDDQGVRLILWRPVVDFLMEEFEVEIEDWLCHGEIAVAYLKHEVAQFAQALYPQIEKARIDSPFRSKHTNFKVALNALCEVELELKSTEDPAADVAERIRRRLKQRARSLGMAEAAAESRVELAARVERLPQWAVEACLEFVRRLDKPSPLQAALASESVLAKDWLRPEEEEAWRSL